MSFQVEYFQINPKLNYYKCIGVPKDQTTRKVRIYRPANTTMQSGTSSSQARLWRIDFETQDRWENSLMGWASSYVFYIKMYV